MSTQVIRLGDRNVVLAAGTESMSNAHYGLPRGDNDEFTSSFIVRFGILI